MKAALLAQGYPRLRLAQLPDDGSQGSRQLLLALSWLLARKPLLERLLARTRVRLGDELPASEVRVRWGEPVPPVAQAWGSACSCPQGSPQGSVGVSAVRPRALPLPLLQDRVCVPTGSGLAPLLAPGTPGSVSGASFLFPLQCGALASPGLPAPRLEADGPVDARHLQWLMGKLRFRWRNLMASQQEQCALLGKVGPHGLSTWAVTLPLQAAQLLPCPWPVPPGPAWAGGSAFGWMRTFQAWLGPHWLAAARSLSLGL